MFTGIQSACLAVYFKKKESRYCHVAGLLGVCQKTQKSQLTLKVTYWTILHLLQILKLLIKHKWEEKTFRSFIWQVSILNE